jgi:O-antigen ligase/polysaccharide polymerase Wzy-like membrane protein
MTARVSARTIAAVGAIALALGNLGRIPAGALGGRGAPIVALDLVVVAVWMVLLYALATRRAQLAIDGVAGAASVFVVVALISTALAFSRYNLGAADGLGVVAFLVRWVAYFGWYPFVAWCLTADESRDAWRDVERALLAFCVFGILQSAFLPGFAQMVNAGGTLKEWDVQGRRLVSTLLDPNFAGLVIVIALLFRLARVAENEKESGPAMVLLSAGVLLTVSRSAILALAVGLGVLVLARGLKLRLIKLFVVGALLLLPFLSFAIAFAAGFHKLGFDMSAAQRFVPWTRALRLIAEHPLLGIGFNAIQQAQESHGWRPIGGADVSLDGGLLFVAAMTGLIGVGIYVLMMISVSRAARRAWRDTDVPALDRAHATATAASTAAVVVHSLFVNSLLLPFVMQILWVMWGRLAHISASRRARLGLPAARRIMVPGELIGAPARASLLQFAGFVTLLGVAGACDPCAGTVNCSSSPHYEATGTIVDHHTGIGVAGARVDAVFQAQGGVVNASALTDKDGLWRLTADAPGAASTTAIFTVTAPGHAAYNTAPVAVHAVTTRGNADVMGQWTEAPFARFLATVVHAGVPLVGASVAFAPTTDGVTFESESTVATNGSGIFEMDLSSPAAAAVGALTIVHSSLARPETIERFSIPLGYTFGVPHPTTTIAVGGQIAYGGEVIFRGTGEKAANVQVTFARTGGIATDPTSVTTTTNASGFFRLDLNPLEKGEVIGDLTFTPRAGAPAAYHDVRLATYDSVAIRSLGVWTYGAAWAWAVELWRFDSLKAVPNVGVAFHATSGLPIDSSKFQNLRTDASGRVELRGAVRDTGTVIGTIVVFPASGPPRTIPNVRLHTNFDDQLHFGGVYGFGPALRYVGEVLQQNGAPVAGAQITWTQTSGVAATPNPLQSATTADGRFPLTLFPSQDGEVVGTIRVRPPPPWPANSEFVFSDLRLNSFESSDVKLAVTYRIPPP